MGRLLRGRDSEIEDLQGLLRAAREGVSSVRVLQGEPGIGKTTLLELALELADGFGVMRARGVESESEIAFAGLQELFSPAIDRLEGLPDRQRAVLAGALALGPPVAGDPLAVRAASLSMLAAVAEEAPLLVLIDDAHWLDLPSAEAIAFACRRLHHEGVVVLFAKRPAEPSSSDLAGLPVLEVQALAADAATAVVTETAGRKIDAAVLTRVVEIAQGNPLALEEFPRMLTAAQVAGHEPLSEPLLISSGLEHAFARRLERLSAESREALLIAAASDQDRLWTVAAALVTRGLNQSALDPAERAGVVAIADGALQFRHPLLRSVIYQSASGEQRRRAHAALAAAADETADRRAWHLAAAAAEPDEHVALALEEAAGRAATRGGLSTAARTYQRAATLSPNTEARCGRLLLAASLAQASGRPDWAAALVDEGLPLATGAAARADLEHVAAAAERSGGSALRARTLMSEAAARIAGEDPTRAVVILIDAVLTAQMGGDLHAAAATARQASELANSPALRSFAELTVAQVALARGELPAAEFELIRARADGASTLALPASAAIAVEMLLSNARVEHEPVEGGRSAGIDPLIEAARRQGALGQLPFLLGHGAYIDCREGDWTRARLRASEAAELAEDTRQWNFRAWALVNLARLEAAQGLETDCRDHFAEALGLAQGHDLGSLQVHLYSLIGFLELGLGNIPTAVEQLERCAQQANDYQLGYPPIVPYEPDLIEALHAIGRDRDAAAATDLLQQRARRTQSCWGLAVVSRCRGLLAADDTYEEEFQTALSLHDRVPSAFERARTAVCYGERLRRSRRRADAREHLRSALAVFDRLGARPWAERAHRELQATGVTARSRHDPADLDQLTPQELRVALVIAAGATVRDTADQLFLSPKTIEAHLGRAYRKLSVHNRAQLATIISRRETLGP